jgi:hypothetical protein
LNNTEKQIKIENGIVGFFKRIENLDNLMQRVTKGGMQAVIEFRETNKRVLVDLSSSPIQVIEGKQGIEGSVSMAATANDMHDALIGKLGLVDGINQRRLLTKGGMCHLVTFFPVLGLVPVLYAEHLRSTNGARKKSGWFGRMWAGIFGFFFRMAAFIGGLFMRRHKPQELIDAFNSMSRGAGRFSPAIENKLVAKRKRKTSHPLQPRAPGFLRRTWLKLVSGGLYIAGWKLSLLKYKLKIPIDLFRVLTSLSKALGKPV